MTNPEIVLRLNAMGDILLTIPALRKLKERGCEPHLVIHQRWKAIADFLPAKIHYFTGAADLLKLAAQLNSLKPSAVHDLQGKAATIALRLLIRAERKTVYQKRSLPEQFKAIFKNYPLIFSDQRPIWQKYMQTCGLPYGNPDPSLVLSESYMAEARQLLTGFGLTPQQFFLLHADASKPGKELPVDLLQAVVKKLHIKVALIGTGKKDFDLPKEVLDLRNRMELHQLPGLMKLSAGIISSDSGPMHLARACEIPVVGIFVQTDPSLGFSPVPGKNVMVISNPLPCKPCSLHGQRQVCPEGHFACRKFNPEEVAEKISRFLEKQL
jgi:ADP-heptose:LPS heptosyltransferase